MCSTLPYTAPTLLTPLTQLQGMTYQIFRNPYHAHQLYEMGLRPETAFGCIINYLLELKQEVCVGGGGEKG